MVKVYTENAPAAIGPYSQAMISGGLLLTSGQIPVDPKTNAVVEGGIEEQAEQVMKNLAAVLEAAGTSFDRVVKTTCFILRLSSGALLRRSREASERGPL